MKRTLKAALALAIGLSFWASRVQAAEADSLMVTITPNAFYAVDIATGSVNLNLGSVDLGTSTQTVSPATVTVQSSFATTDLRLVGGIAAASDPWLFDADTSNQNGDRLAAWATFTSIARSSAPTQTGDYFSGTVPAAADSDVISTTSRYVGDSATQSTSNLFENNTEFANKDMDSLPPSPDANALSHLWLYFRLPNATTGTGAQNVTITLTAVQPN
jgi:hypothetical protein